MQLEGQQVPQAMYQEQQPLQLKKNHATKLRKVDSHGKQKVHIKKRSAQTRTAF